MGRQDFKQHPGMRMNRLTAEQAKKLHTASLQILERTGVGLYEPEAVELMKKAGADVSDGNRVGVPSRLVEWALSTAPKQVTIYDRNGNPAMPLGGYDSFFGPRSDCLNIIDHRTNERRRPVLKDVVDGITLADALDNISFVMSMFLPADVNQPVSPHILLNPPYQIALKKVRNNIG